MNVKQKEVSVKHVNKNDTSNELFKKINVSIHSKQKIRKYIVA